MLSQAVGVREYTAVSLFSQNMLGSTVELNVFISYDESDIFLPKKTRNVTRRARIPCGKK